MKKTLLVSLLVAVLICIFAITVSAETVIPDWTETQTIPSIAFKEGFDTTSRVLLSNGDGTYTTYPTNYIIVGSDTKFSVSNELNFNLLNDATENKYNYKYASVVRIEIPSGFVSFEDRAFKSDKGFTSILTCKIPEGATTFGAYVFYNNKTVVEVELPNSLTALGQESFLNATSLKKVSIGSNTEITAQAFSGCTSLETVILAEGITKIGARAFQNTTALKSISLPSTLTTIDEIAFFGSGLVEITIPENVTTIGNKSFENCKSLTKATIRNKVIGQRMFYNTSALKTIVISSDIANISSEGIYGVSQTLLTLYTGSDASKLGTIYNYDRFTKANQVSYEQYLLDVQNGVTYTKATIVYDVNECYAFNNNVHTYDNPLSCVANCTVCSQAKAPSISEHKLSTEYLYSNGFVSAGEKQTKCTVEGCKYSVSEEIPAIIALQGYSSKIGGKSMCVGYTVNQKAYKEYTEAGYTLNYGIVAYIPTEGETNISPVKNDLTGKTDKTIVASVDSAYVAFDFIITGFTSVHNGLSLVMCAYVFDGEKVEYISISNGEIDQTQYAQAVTYKYTEE